MKSDGTLLLSNEKINSFALTDSGCAFKSTFWPKALAHSLLDFWTIFLRFKAHPKLIELFHDRWLQPVRQRWLCVYAELRTSIQVHVKPSKKFHLSNANYSLSKHLPVCWLIVFEVNVANVEKMVHRFWFISFYFEDSIEPNYFLIGFRFLLELLIVANFRWVAARVSSRMSMPLTGRQANRHAHRKN